MKPGWTKTDCRIYYYVATYTDSEEKEDRRKDGSITFVKIVWTYEFEYTKLLILQVATDRDRWRNTV